MAHVHDASVGSETVVSEDLPSTGEAGAEKLRAGERTLVALATPLNYMILRALAERPMRLAELRRATGLPAQTTLRGHLATLREMGALTKRSAEEAPHGVENSLTPMGEEMLLVAEVLASWLAKAPDGSVSLETGAGRGVVKAFIDGWGSTIMRHLASAPMSLTELDRRIPDLSYPALERRLSSMRMAGLIEAHKSRGTGTPYAVTEWARYGVAPLVAASKCERTHMSTGAAPITQVDVEGAFLLVTPLVGLAPTMSGICQLEVDGDPIEARAQSGVLVTVERGRVVACNSQLDSAPSDFAVGSVAKWFGAIRDGTASLLRFGGGRRVAESVVVGLHAVMLIQ